MRALAIGQITPVYMAETWGEVYAELTGQVERAQGLNAFGSPRLTNRQVLAIAQAVRRLAKTWKEPVAYWPEIWYEALGYRATGDKFKVSADHQDAYAPDDTVEGLWSMVRDLLVRFQERNVAPPMLDLDLSAQGYRDALAAAWTQLKIDRGQPVKRKRRKVKIPTAPGKDPIEVDEPVIPAPGPPVTGPAVPSISRSTGLLLVLVLVALAVRKR